jgi:beta-mannosidase
MFRTWEFDVRPYLKLGLNTTEIDFVPIEAYAKANEGRPKLFGKPVQNHGMGYVRKPAFQWGWDFAPRLLTTGIWRKIGLVGWDGGRVTDVEVEQDHSKKGQVDLEVKVATEGREAASARVQVLFKGREVAETTSNVVGGTSKANLTISNPRLWWPNGMGNQDLYVVHVDLGNSHGRILDRGEKRIGLRTVRWIPKTDQGPLALTVNGKKFFAKGSNWVPPDSLIVRTTPDQERNLVQMAVAANMNLMRLWGGGYYENDSFFDACDEKGLLVWFEFKFADAPYPSFDPNWLANVKAEAVDNVRRVRHHPSIAVYSGNNEVIGFIRDQTTESSMNRDEYNLLFHTTLRDVVHDLAPDVAYTPGSPEIGDDHYWDVWHGSASFTSYRSRHGFMSEYGFQAFPVPRSVEAFTQPQDRTSVETPVMLEHQKNWRDGNALIVSTLLKSYRKPKDFDSTLWVGQISQAEGILTGVEHWRRDWPNSTASLVWQFDDPWPVTSWSMVDYYHRPKALYYRLRHAYAPVALSGLSDSKTGKVELWAVNDRPKLKQGVVDWSLVRLDGSVVRRGSEQVEIPAGTSSKKLGEYAFKPITETEGADNFLFSAKLKTPGEATSSTLLTFVRPKDLKLVDPGIHSSVSPTAAGFRVTLTCSHPALWAWVELAGLDATLSDNFVHLLPGVPVTIDLVPAQKISLARARNSVRVRSLFDTYLPGVEASPIIRPDDHGRLVMKADDAEIEGEGATLEPGTPSNIGTWLNIDTSLRWTIREAEAGEYDVTAIISAPQSDAGAAFELAVDKSRLAGTVPATKDWKDYVEIKLGRVTVSKDGNISISLRATSMPHDRIMNLRSITLTPTKP